MGETEIIFNCIFNTEVKLNLYEFVKSTKEVLGLDMDVDKAKILLSRINYRVSGFFAFIIK